MEIDVEAASGVEIWLGESKWWRGKKVGKGEVEFFLRKAEAFREHEGPGLELLRVWFFAHDGFAPEAEALMQEKGMLWSTRDDLNELLALSGLRSLPEL